jgi:hypothetical protein
VREREREDEKWMRMRMRGGDGLQVELIMMVNRVCNKRVVRVWGSCIDYYQGNDNKS